MKGVVGALVGTVLLAGCVMAQGRQYMGLRQETWSSPVPLVSVLCRHVRTAIGGV